MSLTVRRNLLSLGPEHRGHWACAIIAGCCLWGPVTEAEQTPERQIGQLYGPETVWYCETLRRGYTLSALAEQLLTALVPGSEVTTSTAIRYDRALSESVGEDCERGKVVYTLTAQPEIVTKTLRFLPVGATDLDCRAISSSLGIVGPCIAVVERAVFAAALIRLPGRVKYTAGYVQLARPIPAEAPRRCHRPIV